NRRGACRRGGFAATLSPHGGGAPTRAPPRALGRQGRGPGKPKNPPNGRGPKPPPRAPPPPPPAPGARRPPRSACPQQAGAGGGASAARSKKTNDVSTLEACQDTSAPLVTSLTRSRARSKTSASGKPPSRIISARACASCPYRPFPFRPTSPPPPFSSRRSLP